MTGSPEAREKAEHAHSFCRCIGSKWSVLSMRRGYLATETSRDAFSTWTADDSHLSQLARQKTPAQFVVVNGEFTKTLKKVDSSSRDSWCLICGINFKLSGQGSFFSMTTTPGIKESLTHWRLRVLWSLHYKLAVGNKQPMCNTKGQLIGSKKQHSLDLE